MKGNYTWSDIINHKWFDDISNGEVFVLMEKKTFADVKDIAQTQILSLSEAQAWSEKSNEKRIAYVVFGKEPNGEWFTYIGQFGKNKNQLHLKPTFIDSINSEPEIYSDVLNFVKEKFFKECSVVINDESKEKTKINEGRKNIMEETKFPIKEYDDRGNLTYYESITGFWEKWEYDKNDNLTYWENCYGDGCKSEYDDSGNLIYSEDVYGNWWKYGYDDNGNKTFYENGFGYWEKWEYDKYGCLTYRENSDGYKFGASREEREAEIIEKNNDESDDSEITDSILEQNLSEVQEDNKSYNIDELFDSQGKYIGRPTKKAILAKTEKSIWLSTNWIYPDKQECNMKKFLIETNEDRMMAFVDDKERAFVLKIDAELTLETLINADYSKFDGCKTAEDCARVMGKSKKQHIVDFEKLLTDAKVCTIFSKYGNWEKREYDNKVGKETYYEDSIGLWFKYEYDKDGNETYYENSFGKKRGTPKKIQNDSDDSENDSEIIIEEKSTHRGR